MKTTNEQWIADAMDLYEASLIRYAMLFTNSEDRARDIVQDTFIKLCRQERKKVETFIKAWLYKVCRNRSLEVLRKENRMMELTDSTLIKTGGTSPSTDMQAVQNDDLKLALSLVETLPEKQQELIQVTQTAHQTKQLQKQLNTLQQTITNQPKDFSPKDSLTKIIQKQNLIKQTTLTQRQRPIDNQYTETTLTCELKQVTQKQLITLLTQCQTQTLTPKTTNITQTNNSLNATLTFSNITLR